MISARNYAAAAVRSIEAVITKRDRMTPKPTDEDIRALKQVSSAIRSAVHFALPDGARIFSDNFKGIRDTEIRLPFPVITLEYYIPRPVAPNATIYAEKVLILAFETVDSFYETDDPELLIDAFVITEAEHGFWSPHTSAVRMRSKWDIDPNYSSEGATVMFRTVLPGLYENYCASKTKDEIDGVFARSYRGALEALLEFLEALACSNVSTEIIQHESKRLNEKRVRKGKLPLYETRVLSIPVPNIRAPRGECGHSDRRGPRQHLRRGHIRILPDDRRIWVNSCVVGSRAEGVIHKRYTVDKQ